MLLDKLNENCKFFHILHHNHWQNFSECLFFPNFLWFQIFGAVSFWKKDIMYHVPSKWCFTGYFCYHWQKEKELVRLCWTGYEPLPIHRRDPTTARHGNFCLLCFHPGPVRSSLDNLVTQGSPRVTILMPGLAWTPDQHRAMIHRNPDLKPSTIPDLHVAGLQEHATTPSR